jgi:hypothetical protein
MDGRVCNGADEDVGDGSGEGDCLAMDGRGCRPEEPALED